MGTGQLDLTAYLHGTTTTLQTGVAAEISSRISKGVSIFGQAYGGTNWAQDTGHQLEYGALTGLRMTW